MDAARRSSTLLHEAVLKSFHIAKVFKVRYQPASVAAAALTRGRRLGNETREQR